jgi:hypothetical protein
MSAGEASIGRNQLGIAAKGDAPNGSWARRRVAIVYRRIPLIREMATSRNDEVTISHFSDIAL